VLQQLLKWLRTKTTKNTRQPAAEAQGMNLMKKVENQHHSPTATVH
jgi:hypothetical protein